MTARRARGRRWRRIAFFVFLAVVAVLLVRYAASVDWPQVGATLADYSVLTLAGAGALTIGSYQLYSCYDMAEPR